MLCGSGCKKPGAYALCSGCTGDKGSVIDTPLATGKVVCAYYLVLQDAENRLLVFEREGPCGNATQACAPKLSLALRSGTRVQLTARVTPASGDACAGQHERYDWFFDPQRKARVLAVEQTPRAQRKLAEVELAEEAARVTGRDCKGVVPFDPVDL
jgi:hypothetical protein